MTPDENGGRLPGRDVLEGKQALESMQEAKPQEGAGQRQIIVTAHPAVDEELSASITLPTAGGQTYSVTLVMVPEDELEFEYGDPAETAMGSRHDILEDLTAVYWTRDIRLFIGLFLSTCEMTGTASWRAHTILDDDEHVATALDTYQEWQDSLTRKKRLFRLLDTAEERRENPVFDTALEQGQAYHPTGAEGRTDRFVQNLLSNTDILHPHKCYQNALHLYGSTQNTDRVQYCEGVMLPGQAARPIIHAWLLVDGTIVEPTLPWHMPYGGDAVYFGVKIDHAEVRDAQIHAAQNQGQLPTPLGVSEEDRDRLRADPGRERQQQ